MFQRMICLISLTTILSNSVLADNVVPSPPDNNPPPIYLTLHEPAPYAGFLLSEERVKEMRGWKLTADALTQENASLKTEIGLLQDNFSKKDQQLQLALNENDILAKKERNTDFEKVMWFLIGVGVAGTAVWLGSKVTR